MNKLIVLILVTFIILITNYIYVTNEGFTSTDASSGEQQSNCNNASYLEENCLSCRSYNTEDSCPEDGCEWDSTTNKCIDTTNTDSNCGQITAVDGSEYNVHTVCPYSPECVGICLNDFTYTAENTPQYSNSNTPPWNLMRGNLKINTTGDDNDESHLFISSRCYECIKNFYKITKLMKENSCGQA